MTILNFIPDYKEYDDLTDIDPNDIAAIDREQNHRCPYMPKMIEEKNKFVFLSEFMKHAIRVYNKTGILYKMVSSTIDTGDDLLICKEEPEKSRRLITLQFKGIITGCNRRYRRICNRRGNGTTDQRRGRERQYQQNEYDFLVGVDKKTEEIFIFDYDSIRDQKKDNYYKQHVTINENNIIDWEKHNVAYNGWELLMPELKEMNK